MKTIFYTLICLAVLTSCNNQNSSNDGGLDATTIETDKEDVKEPKFEFKERVWDFGNITEGERVEHTFKFKNVGEGDLVISNCTASCGCTIPEWPKEPIPPGGEGQIKVEFNSAGKSDAVTKDITIFANTTPVKSTLQIKVFINKKES